MDSTSKFVFWDSYTCENCGYELSGEMAFCPKCGSPNTELAREKEQAEAEAKAKAEAEAEAKAKKQKLLQGVRKVCADFLEEAEEWTDGASYYKKSSGILGYVGLGDKDDEVSYVCCDLDDERTDCYAITSEGFAYREHGWFGDSNWYSFDELSDAEIELRYDEDVEANYLYIDDKEISLALNDYETEKLYDLLCDIVIAWDKAKREFSE